VEIAKYRPAEKWFPNLRRIVAHYKTAADIIPLTQISHANIEYLAMRDDRCLKPKEEISRVVSDVFERFRQLGSLKHLSLSVNHDCMQIIGEAKYLERLYIGRQSHYHLTDILEKPRLKKLCTSLTSRSPYINHRQTRKGLRNLSSLELRLSKMHLDGFISRELQNVVLFLKALDNPSLEYFHIKFPQTCTSDSFSAILTEAGNNCKLSTLKRLFLTSKVNPTDFLGRSRNSVQLRGGIISGYTLRSAFASILPLPMLREFRISISSSFLQYAGEAEMTQIAEGMPQLQLLQLGNDGFDTKDDFVPLYQMISFCSMFPNLEKVILCTVEGSDISKETKSNLVSTRVSLLDIRRGNFEKHIVAPYIRRCFPNLITFKYTSHSAGNDKSSKQAEEDWLIRAVRAVRGEDSSPL
jgi:hypothetical protein